MIHMLARREGLKRRKASGKRMMILKAIGAGALGPGEPYLFVCQLDTVDTETELKSRYQLVAHSGILIFLAKAPLKSHACDCFHDRSSNPQTTRPYIWLFAFCFLLKRPEFRI